MTVRQNFHLLLVFQLNTLLQSCIQDDKTVTSLVESFIKGRNNSSVGKLHGYVPILLPQLELAFGAFATNEHSRGPNLSYCHYIFISRYYIPILLNGLVKTID